MLIFFDAVRQLDKKPRVLLIGSGEEYGHIKEGECPIVEDNTVRPGNIYAATAYARICWERYILMLMALI